MGIPEQLDSISKNVPASQKGDLPPIHPVIAPAIMAVLARTSFGSLPIAEVRDLRIGS